MPGLCDLAAWAAYHITSKVIFSDLGIKARLRGKTDESGCVQVRCVSKTLLFRSRAQKSCQSWGCHLGVTGTWAVTHWLMGPSAQ